MNNANELKVTEGSGDTRPALLDYLNSVSYVRDMREAMGISFANLSRMTRKSSSYLHRLCNGKAPVVEEMLPGLTKVFQLSQNESRYLAQLIEFEAAVDFEAKKRRLIGLMESRLARENARQLQVDPDDEAGKLRQLLTWEFVALLTLIQVGGIENDEHKIADMFVGKMESRRVRSLIHQMERVGLIEISRDNLLVSKKGGTIAIHSDAHRQEAMKWFHRAILEKAIESISILENRLRMFSSQTIRMDAEQFVAFRSYLEEYFSGELVEKARAFAKQSTSEKKVVVQLGGYFFPLMNSELVLEYLHTAPAAQRDGEEHPDEHEEKA